MELITLMNEIGYVQAQFLTTTKNIKGWNGKIPPSAIQYSPLRNKWKMPCLEISVWRRDVEEGMWTAVEGFQRVSQYYIIAGLLTSFKWSTRVQDEHFLF